MNSKMRDSFNEVCSHEDLSTELSCILDKGFVEINKCVLFLCFKSNEFGFSSIFSFHVKRIGEFVLDISSIENFENEIYVEILN